MSQDHPLLRLPVFRSHQPPPLPFPPKSWVHLRSCRNGQPGRVQRYWRGLVVVYWPQFDFTGRYKPDRLMSADSVAVE